MKGRFSDRRNIIDTCACKVAASKLRPSDSCHHRVLHARGGRGEHGKDSIRVNVHSTGYGLFIAKQVTESNQGTIRAESEGPGKGSTFSVEFPVVA